MPYWRLCIDSRKLAVLVSRHVQVCEQQLQQLLGGGLDAGGRGGGGDADADHPDVMRLRHEIETWRLVETLFAKIDGEVPEPDVSDERGSVPGEESPSGVMLVPMGAASPGDGGGADTMALGTPAKTPASVTVALCTPSDYDMNNDDVGAAPDPLSGGEDGSAAAAQQQQQHGKDEERTLLAAQQRRAALSLWLQRQARRRVEEDLQTVSSPAAVVLQLLAAHQLAAAAGAAVAGGDPRLAMLVARVGGPWPSGCRDRSRSKHARGVA